MIIVVLACVLVVVMVVPPVPHRSCSGLIQQGSNIAACHSSLAPWVESALPCGVGLTPCRTVCTEKFLASNNMQHSSKLGLSAGCGVACSGRLWSRGRWALWPAGHILHVIVGSHAQIVEAVILSERRVGTRASEHCLHKRAHRGCRITADPQGFSTRIKKLEILLWLYA